MKTLPSLTHDDAVDVVRAALEAAEALSCAVVVAVVDLSGQLLELSRMDGVRGYSVDLALRKARTASGTGFSTALLAEALKGQPLGGEVLAVAGGVPVMIDSEIAGAIGVSGAQPDEDEAVAMAGLVALNG